MSGGTATALALLLYGLGFAPFIGIALRPESARIFGLMATAALLGLAFFSTGILQGSSVTPPEVSRLLRTIPREDRCHEVFQVLRQNRFILEMPGPEGLVVNSAVWDQLPPTVRDAVEDCARSMIQTDKGAGPFKIIRR